MSSSFSVRLVAFVAATAFSVPAVAQEMPRETLVMPFENLHTDPKLYWLGEGSAVLLSELLERNDMRIIPREERVSAFDRLQLPQGDAPSHATTIKVGQLVSASDVVIGSYELNGDELTVRARTLRLDVGRLTPEVVEGGPLADFFDIYDRAARRLSGGVGAAPPPEEGTLLASPQAFEFYVKGLIAEAPATARSYLEQAAKAAPNEDRIPLALWQVHADTGNHLLALGVAARVPSTSRHYREAAYLMARSQIELEHYDAAFKTLDALRSTGRSAEVLSALGVVQLRRGAGAEGSSPTYYFNQAAQIDPTDADYFFNLGYAYWLAKDHAASLYWLREAVRRDPADGDAHFVLSAALQRTGNQAEAARERQLAERLSADWEEVTGPAADAVPLRLERLKNRLDSAQNRVDALMTSVGQRDQQELAFFHLEAGRRAYDREADREAERELRRSLFLSPYMAEGHLLLGRVHLRGGRIDEAIQAFQIALWSAETATAHIALAEAYLAAEDLDAARNEVELALRLDPESEEALALRAKIAGQ